MTITAHPLSWPIGQKPRTDAERVHSQFGREWNHKPTLGAGCMDLLAEMDRMGVHRDDIIVSTNVALRLDGLPRSNQRAPENPGVAVYWTQSEKNHVLACDRYLSVGCNLRAIVKHIGAVRGIARWGCGTLEQAFAGYMALPETAGGEAWWQVLQLEAPSHDERVIHGAFRAAALKNHPDHDHHDRLLWHRQQDALKQGIEASRAAP